MDHAGGVVPGVFAVKQGLCHDGLAQVALGIRLAHAGVDRLLQAPAHQVHLLAQGQKHHGKPRVLADAQAFLSAGAVVLNQLLQHVLPQGGGFLMGGGVQRLHHVLADDVVGL
jgi:hypothetical protein